MTKTELIAKTAGKAGLAKKDVAGVVNALFEVIKESLKNGEEVRITGFGSFKVVERAARKGKNLQTSDMSLTYGFRTARDLFKKLKHEAEILESEVTSDALFNFVVTAYHLCEWVERDPQVSKSAKADVPNIRKETWIAICRDIANASKHFSLNRSYKNQVVKNTESIQGFGFGRYGYGGYGVGEEDIVIELSDGSRYDALELKEQVISIWEKFFNKHNLNK